MAGSQSDVEAAVAKPTQPENNPWPKRLEAWNKFSEKFHERGCKIEQRYEDEREASTSDALTGAKKVNMFYSNVTVIKESLYNSLPKPSVSRLHPGDWDNEAARVAATIMQRGLTYEVACAPYFDPAMKSVILDRLVPGMGTMWINFKPADLATGKPEMITVDFVYWKDLLFDPQRNWEMVTWAGRKLHVEKDEAKRRWGQAALDYTAPQKAGAKPAGDSTEQALMEGKVCVIQMWDKNTRTVIDMTPDGTILKTTPDPYQLKNFFPCAKPLIAAPPTRKFLPMADYYMAQDQYMELDILYARINLLIEAIKVAGVYDASIPEIGRMLQGAENKLIPVDNWAMLADKGGTAGVIDWFPVEEVAGVLTHLVSTYEFIKTQLFEVSGMADIIRGSTNQYETAAAQQIKAQFASVRMNGLQRDVSIFVRDNVRIIGEMMCQLYTKEKLSAIVGQLPQADQQYVDPALAILRNDYISHYNIDIEADSLTQADWGLQQEQRMAYVQAMSNFLTSSIPAIESNPELAPLLVQIVKFASVGFKGASELEGTLDSVLDGLAKQAQEDATNPQPPEPSPEEKKMQAQMQLEQQKAQMEQAKMQQDMALKREEHQMKLQMQQAEFAHKQQMNQAELEFKRIEHMMDLDYESKKFALKMQAEAVHGAQEAEQNERRFQDERRQDAVQSAVSIATKAAESEANIANKKEERQVIAGPPKPKNKRR